MRLITGEQIMFVIQMHPGATWAELRTHLPDMKLATFSNGLSTLVSQKMVLTKGKPRRQTYTLAKRGEKVVAQAIAEVEATYAFVRSTPSVAAVVENQPALEDYTATEVAV